MSKPVNSQSRQPYLSTAKKCHLMVTKSPSPSIRWPIAGGSCARPFLSAAAMLVLVGCVAEPEASEAYSTPTPTQMAQSAPQGDPQNCREFTAQVMVGGQPQQAVGQACQQPDGTWRVTQNTPGSPQQVYTLPPQAIYVYPYPEAYDWNPWFYGPPFFVGGTVFFADGFHRFHHDGFHHGFQHGFDHRFDHGFDRRWLSPWGFPRRFCPRRFCPRRFSR